MALKPQSHVDNILVQSRVQGDVAALRTVKIVEGIRDLARVVTFALKSQFL